MSLASPADIYACAATNGVLAPNLDFKLPAFHTGDGTTAVEVCPWASGANLRVNQATPTRPRAGTNQSAANHHVFSWEARAKGSTEKWVTASINRVNNAAPTPPKIPITHANAIDVGVFGNFARRPGSRNQAKTRENRGDLGSLDILGSG